MFSSALLIVVWQPLQAQAGDDPVSWSSRVKQINIQTFEVHLTASLEEGWFIYSQYANREGGVFRTCIFFDDGQPVEFQGAVQEVSDLQINHEEFFSKETEYYYHKVTFIQQIKYNGPRPLPITGSIRYIACHKEEGCDPLVKKPFAVIIK